MVVASDEDQDQVVAAVNSGKNVINQMLATCKAVAFAAENQNAREATLSEGSKLGQQFQELLRQMIVVGRSSQNGDEEEEDAAQRELLAASKAVGETVIRIAQLSKQLKGNSSAESIEKAAKRFEDIKKKKNEDSQQVESYSTV